MTYINKADWIAEHPDSRDDFENYDLVSPVTWTDVMTVMNKTAGRYRIGDSRGKLINILGNDYVIYDVEGQDCFNQLPNKSFELEPVDYWVVVLDA